VLLNKAMNKPIHTQTNRYILYLALAVVAVVAFWATVKYAPNSVAAGLTFAVLIGVTGIASVGALWMMWASVRSNRNVFPMVALAAFVPFVFFWYYSNRANEFERSHLKRVVRIAVAGSVMIGAFVALGQLLGTR
jgi:hypothetical protein